MKFYQIETFLELGYSVGRISTGLVVRMKDGVIVTPLSGLETILSDSDKEADDWMVLGYIPGTGFYGTPDASSVGVH